MNLSDIARFRIAAPSKRDPGALPQMHWAAMAVLGAVAFAGVGFAALGALGIVRLLGILALAGSGCAGLLLVLAMRTDPVLWNAFRDDATDKLNVVYAALVWTRRESIRGSATVIYAILAQLKYAEWRYMRYESSSAQQRFHAPAGFAFAPFGGSAV